MKLPTAKYAQDLRRYYRMPAIQTSLTLVLSVFVMAVFIIFALRPTIVSIVTLKKTIAESKKTLTQLDTKVVNLQKASEVLETINPLLPVLNTSIPNSGAMYSPLSTTIEALSIQSGAKLESESLGPTLLFSRIVSPFTPNKKQNVVAMPFTVRVVGSYLSVSGFLTKLLSMERILLVESVTVTKETGAKNSEASVALSVSGSAYYLADEAQLIKLITDSKGTK